MYLKKRKVAAVKYCKDKAEIQRVFNGVCEAADKYRVDWRYMLAECHSRENTNGIICFRFLSRDGNVIDSGEKAKRAWEEYQNAPETARFRQKCEINTRRFSR